MSQNNDFTIEELQEEYTKFLVSSSIEIIVDTLLEKIRTKKDTMGIGAGIREIKSPTSTIFKFIMDVFEVDEQGNKCNRLSSFPFTDPDYEVCVAQSHAIMEVVQRLIKEEISEVIRDEETISIKSKDISEIRKQKKSNVVKFMGDTENNNWKH